MAAKWLTPTQAAAQLGVSESTLWRLLRRGQLGSIKVGGRRRIPATALRHIVQPARNVRGPAEIPPLTIDDPLFRLMGRFQSDGRGPGSADKHGYLRAKR